MSHRGRWLTQVKTSLSQKDRYHELNLRPVFHGIAVSTIWASLIPAYIITCLLSGTSGRDASDLPIGIDYGTAGALVWTAFFIAALFRLLRLPDRRAALGLALLNMRRLTIGYLLATLLIYPITALAILPVDWKFDREFRTYVAMGDAARIRQELGF